MPLTVITLTNAPNSLRGDLTKWLQEISTGVYVGNINTKIRELLWERVTTSIKTGQATISYKARNEIGYKFETYNTARKCINYEGIPLVLVEKSANDDQSIIYGFSNASKNLKAKRMQSKNSYAKNDTYVIIDIETDGLDYSKNRIIEIGALKINGNEKTEFSMLINTNKSIPSEIVLLTGITDEIVKKEGSEEIEVLTQFVEFIKGFTIVGYNVNFDVTFLNIALKKHQLDLIDYKIIDVMQHVKKCFPFIDNYKLLTIVQVLEIDEIVKHRALKDVKLIEMVIKKLNEKDMPVKF